MSGRRYKYDLSDVIGIMWEHDKSDNPITEQVIKNAITTLYGEDAKLPAAAQRTLKSIFEARDYEALYQETKASELLIGDFLLDFRKMYPSAAINENNLDSIIDNHLTKLQPDDAPPKPKTLMERLEEAKAKAALNNNESSHASTQNTDSY